MLVFLKARLAEPTTKAALIAALGAIAAAALGQIGWEAAVVTLIGSLLPIFTPETAKPIVAELTQAVADAARKSAPVLAVMALIGTLAACTAQQVQTAETEISAGIAAACHDVNAAAVANPQSPAVAWASACTPTGMAGLVQNSATVQWLGGLAVQLSQPAAPPA